MKFTTKIGLFYCLLQCSVVLEAYKILGIFPVPSKSHYYLGSKLLKELAKKGHEVTMISPFGEKDLPSNNIIYRDIKVVPELTGGKKKPNFFSDDVSNPYLVTLLLNKIGEKVLNDTMSNKEVKKLLNSDEKFDAVIVDQFVIDGFSYFAHKFEATRILLSTTSAGIWVNPMVGNPSPPSVVADIHLPFTNQMSFYERLQNSLFYLFGELNKHLILFPGQDKIIHQHIPDSKPLQEFVYNISLVLVNAHESFSEPITHVPVMKNIGGFHVSPSGKLPQDLQKYLDDAKDGFVYFSMGSNLKSSDMSTEVKDAILRVFSKLKVKILWKWEEEQLPGQPSNVKLSKWFPQQEILAHPNIKLFISHGGLLSTIEAVYHGVPMLIIPVYGDQRLNAGRSTQQGYALNIVYNQFDETTFENSIRELLTNDSFKKNAMIRSKIFHDRPMKPLDEAVYWVEYVIRHKGAEHLRVASIKLSWYQYLLLDVIVFLIFILMIFLYGAKYLLSVLFCSSKKNKIKTN